MFDWLPDTEDRLREMLDQGLLAERHTVDFKEQLDPGKGANKEHARDLAKFGPDGGVLIVGVNDDGQLTPIQLAEQRERIDQIGRTIPDPPMHVRIEEIPAAGQPGKGYLLVVVPPSPDAPHMVDGRYYGRGDTTKHVLSDAEVQALHQRALTPAARRRGGAGRRGPPRPLPSRTPQARASVRHRVEGQESVSGRARILSVATHVVTPLRSVVRWARPQRSACLGLPLPSVPR
jgi:hypothetical protein